VREGEDAIKRIFAPEFRNQLDAVGAFVGLDAGDRGAGGGKFG
jgi:hypothetical protein